MSLAVVLWTGDARAAASARAVRALGPLQAGDEVWLVPDGPKSSEAVDAARASLPPAQVRVCASTPSRMAAVNRAVAAAEAPWCLFLDATSVLAPTALPALRRQIEAAEQRATNAVPPWPALLVGVSGHRAAADPSPLAHFVAAGAQAATAPWRDGDDLPADAVPSDNWAASRALLGALGGFDEAFGAQVGAVDLARRTYAAGVPLRLCRDVQARRATPTDVARAVLHWRELGHDTLTLLRKHADPHGTDRLVQRLGPYRALRQDAAALAAQLDAVDRRLVAGRRPHPAHIAGLQPSLANLYALSVLEGVLRHPAGPGLWAAASERRPTKAAAPASDAGLRPSSRGAKARRRARGPHA